MFKQSYWIYSALLHGIVLMGLLYFPEGSQSFSKQSNSLVYLNLPTPSSKRSTTHPMRKGAETKQISRPSQKKETLEFQEPSLNSSDGTGTPSAQQDDLLEVRKKIEASLRYPYELRKKKIQGIVLVRIVLNSRGELEFSEILKTSGFEELDQLALEALKEAAPFPPLKSPLKSMDKLHLSLPIDFRLTAHLE